MSNSPLHVVNFSGGLCSFWAAMRVKERHGVEDMVLLFADTLIEDAELYEFNEQAASLRRGGITQSLWLIDLAKRIEAGEKFDKYDWGGCGCGGATVEAA